MTPIRRLILASGMTNLGDGITVLAWAWIASVLTRDPLWIAIVPAAVRLPWLIGALPAGLLTDRHDRRWLVAGADFGRAVVFVTLAVVIWSSEPLPPAPAEGVSQPGLMGALILGALLVGFAEVLRDSAAATMVPSIVASQDLERANGRLSSVETVGNELAGPAFGAFVLAWALAAPFAISAGLYVIGALLVLRLTGRFRPTPRPRRWRAELREGWSVLRGHCFLMNLVWITAVWNLLFDMAMIGLILHGQENAGMDAPTYGLVLAFGALGGVLGGWVGHRVVDRLGAGRTAQIASLAGTPVFALIALASGPVMIAAALLLSGFFGVLWNMVSTSYRQRRVPHDLRGRVGAIYRLAACGAAPLGIVLSGFLVRGGEAVLPREVALTLPFWVAAIGVSALNVVIWRRLFEGFSQTSPSPVRTA